MLATSIDDAVAEALENDNVALQNLAASKYVQVLFHLMLGCKLVKWKVFHVIANCHLYSFAC